MDVLPLSHAVVLCKLGCDVFRWTDLLVHAAATLLPAVPWSCFLWLPRNSLLPLVSLPPNRCLMPLRPPRALGAWPWSPTSFKCSLVSGVGNVRSSA